MRLSELLTEQTVVPELLAETRDGALEELLEALVRAGRISLQDRPQVLETLIQREAEGSTGFGRGVAVPHCRHPAVKEMVMAVGRSTKGIDFQALDDAPVYSVLLLLSPPGDQDSHLQAMELIFRHLQQDSFRKLLRRSDVVEKLIEQVNEEEAA